MVKDKYSVLLPQLKKADPIPQVVVQFTSDSAAAEELMSVYLKKIESLGEAVEAVRLNGLEADASAFHAELSTIPMFDTTRLLWLRHADAILKKIAANNTVKGYFLRDFENIPPKTFVLIQSEAKKLPTPLLSISQNGWVFEEETLRENDLSAFILRRAHLMEFEIAPEAVEELAIRYAPNPSLISTAMDRLFAYCLHEKKIDKGDVEEVCFEVEGDMVFKITDMIAARRIDKALDLFVHHKFTDAGLLTTMISRLFVDVGRYRSLKALGLGTKEIHQRLQWNVNHQFVMRKNEERVELMQKKYGVAEVSHVLGRLFDLDRRVKENTGASDQQTILTMFIASLSAGR